jgi:hypothetical protein
MLHVLLALARRQGERAMRHPLAERRQHRARYSPETWVTVESRDRGHSVMIVVGTKEVAHALEASIAHGPEDSSDR